MGFWRRLFGGTDQPAAAAPATTGPGGAMGDMVKMLARAPESQQRTMLADRMEMFLPQSDDKRAQSMRMMLDAALDLPADQYQSIAASRTRVLMGFPQEDRMTLMKTHARSPVSGSLPPSAGTPWPGECGDTRRCSLRQNKRVAEPARS